MSARAEIRFIGPDPASGTPRFELDLGSNFRYRLDVATEHRLFDGAQAGARTAQNFFTTGNVDQPGGGVVLYTLSSAGWNDLVLTTNRLYYRLTTYGTGSDSVRRSVPLDQSSAAPYIDTAEPAVSALSPSRGPVGGGTTVTLSGSGFTGATEVTFGGVTALFQVLGSSQIRATTPQGTQALPVPVLVETPFGASSSGPGAPRFTYEQPAPVTAIEVTFPDLAAADPSTLRDAHELPADARAGDLVDPRPRTRVRIAAFEVDAAGLRTPVADGTPLRIAVETPAVSGPTPSNPPGTWALYAGATPLAGDRVTTSAGAAEIELRCEPRAEGWRRASTNPTRLEEVAGATYRVIAEADTGTARGESPVLRIVPGLPHRIELLGSLDDVGVALSDLTTPSGAPLALGAIIDTVRDALLYPFSPVPVVERLGALDIRLGAARLRRDPQTGALQPVPNAMAVLMLIHVTDDAGNPVGLLEGDDLNTLRPDIELIRFPMFGLRPFVITPTGDASDPAATVWRGRVPVSNPLPRGVWGCYLVPAGSVATAQTTIRVGIRRVVNGTPTTLKTDDFVVYADPPAHYAKWSKWFFEGEVGDGATFLAEIALSLIPIVGDGRDLLLYGSQQLQDRQLGTIDHVIAAMALAGLLLDVANVLSLGASAPADATVGALKAGTKLLKRVASPDLAESFARALRTRLGNLPRPPSTPDYWNSPEFLDLTAFLDELKVFGRKIVPLLQDPQKLQTLLGLMGMALLVVQLPDLLKLFDQYSVEEIMDLLWGLAALDEENMDRVT